MSEVPRERLIDVEWSGEMQRFMVEVARKAAEDAINRMPSPPNHGRVNHFNGATKVVFWMLGVFGIVMSTLFALVLQAVYTTNGAVNQLSGRQDASQSQIGQMQQEMSAFQSEIMALAQRRQNGGQ
jgi:cell division protein FtsL